MKIVRGIARPMLMAAALGLVACGGGSDSPPPAAALAPPASSLTLASFAPSSGGAGAVITVTGSGFTGLLGARIGGASASFAIVSDGELQVTVPVGAATGRIELSASGRSVVSATDFSVTSAPQVASVTPTAVLSGGRVTLGGTSLDRVREIRLNAVQLPIVTQSATAIAVDIVSNAGSGVLNVIDVDGVSRPVAQQLTVYGPMTLASFAPTSIVTGNTLTINGTNLDRATGVVFANGATAAVATRSGTTRITASVPDAAASGPIRVQGNANDEVVAPTALTVIPAIRVDPNAIYNVAAAGSPVTVPGAGLTEVSAVMVGSTAATIMSRSATQLVFTMPSGPACGALLLQSASQPAVAAGTVVVGSGCAATLAGIEFAQAFAQPSTDPRQRLVPGKETWVRVLLLASQSGVASPTVRLTGYRGVAILGTLDMAGPSAVPAGSGTTVPDSVRYDERQSYNAELPAAWVASGLSVRVEVDPEQRLGPAIIADATPRIGNSTRLNIVLVPVVSGGFTPTLPSATAVVNELERRFPLARSSISVTTRAPYTLSSVTDGLDTQTEWSSALSELRQLRDLENPGNTYRYYYGFVRRSGGSVAGIGYVPGRTALGWDSTSGWSRTMSHELGHNFSRPHAPCGSVANPDANYPYAGGLLGPTALVDAIPPALDVISPLNQSDIMGYCNGTWFSDYNYAVMQSHLEAQPQASMALASAQSGGDATKQAETGLLLISGSIGLDGASFNPVQALRGAPMASSGAYTLRIVTRDGRAIEQAFDAELVDHAMPPERHFTVTVIDPGPIAQLEILHAGIAVAMRASGLATAQRADATRRSPLAVDWSERNGVLQVRWDASAAPYLSVTHVGLERTALAISRRHGVAEFSTAHLPAGGSFEFGLSDGFNAEVVRVNR
jgi:hypothetical protein